MKKVFEMDGSGGRADYSRSTPEEFRTAPRDWTELRRFVGPAPVGNQRNRVCCVVTSDGSTRLSFGLGFLSDDGSFNLVKFIPLNRSRDFLAVLTEATRAFPPPVLR